MTGAMGSRLGSGQAQFGSRSKRIVLAAPRALPDSWTLFLAVFDPREMLSTFPIDAELPIISTMSSDQENEEG